MALNDVRINFTDVELTDENTTVDEWGMGFIEARCRHCGAHLHLNDHGVVTCLNACYLSVGAYRRMQADLSALSANREGNHG